MRKKRGKDRRVSLLLEEFVLSLDENSEDKTVQELSEFFSIGRGITALIGGGGKTSTMYALAEELRKKGSVIVCTSTHILRPPQVPFFERLERRLNCGEVVSVGSIDGQKLSTPEQSFDELVTLADYILVEADGSKQLPLKAHAAHEPVIPKEAKTVLAVVGIDAIGQPIKNAAHRPALYAALAGEREDAPVTAQMIARVLSTYPHFDGVVINKADNEARVQQAEALAALFGVPAAITAWQTEAPIKSYRRKKA